MKTMLVSEFKAKCIAALKEVQRTREPMLITSRGKPLVTVQPIEGRRAGKRLGGLKRRMTIRRDVVKANTARDWEMLHRDPADRLLVAAARRNGLTLVTADDRILAYPHARSQDARR